MTRTRTALAAVLATGLLALSACGATDGADPEAERSATQPADAPPATAPAAEAADSHGSGHYAEPAKSRRLRAGETRTTIAEKISFDSRNSPSWSKHPPKAYAWNW